MSDQLRLTLLGTGSSGGVPRIGNDWGACDPSEPKNRRRRCSALIERVRAGAERPTRLLIDTAPDMREQLLELHIGELDAVAISHDHADQTHGLDDLRAIALRMRQQVRVHMDDETAATLVPKFGYCFEGKGGYPAILKRSDRIVVGEQFEVNGPSGAIAALPIRQQHGRIVSLGFRFGGVAYCNDVSALPDEAMAALEGLDVLLVDALRYTPHPTHAHLDRALEWIEALRPQRAILTNLHIDMDYTTLLRTLPDGVEPAYDGLSVSIPYAV